MNCDKTGSAHWCNDKGVKVVQLKSGSTNGSKNEYLGAVVQMCAECRKANNGGFKLVKSAKA